MFDTRYYLVTICAVFLALATGILVGITYGEDFLIYNQLEVIEQLERELNLARDRTLALEEEVAIWGGFQDIFWENIYAELPREELSLRVVSDSFQLARETVELLEKRGIGCSTVVFTSKIEPSIAEVERIYISETGVDASLAGDKGLLIPALLGGDPGFLLSLQEKGKIEMWGDLSGDFKGDLVLVLCGNNNTTGRILEETALRLQKEDCRTIAAFSGGGSRELPAGYQEWGDTVIDHLETFWGRLTLLETLRTGAKGHYGFESGRGLFPTGER